MTASNEKTNITSLERKDLIRKASAIINIQYKEAFQRISKN